MFSQLYTQKINDIGAKTEEKFVFMYVHKLWFLLDENDSYDYFETKLTTKVS